MNFKVKATISTGLLICHIVNGHNKIIMTLKGTGEKSVELVPDTEYRIEYFYWSATATKYTIDANFDPEIPGFNAIHLEDETDGPYQSQPEHYTFSTPTNQFAS